MKLESFRHRYWRKRHTVGVAFLLIALAVQLFLLRALPYSKCFLAPKTVEEALSEKDPLTLGDLNWHPGPYASAASLEPMRVIARAHCPGLSSFETATCLANFFAGRFPHGNPKREFFDSNYDPAKVLSNHLAGEPGHCVTRTGLLAATLLAMGIPARVVQIQPLDGSSGHNVLEIWDSKMGGWVLMDPTYSGSLDMANRHAAAISLPMESITPRWQQEPALHKVLNVTLTDAQKFYTEQRLRTSNIVYPEPWLYTRVGKSIAPRPFQGQFVMVGSTSLRLGLGQRLLQSGILLTLVGLALTAGMLAFRMVRRFQPRVLTPRGQTFHPHLESENAAVLDTVTLP